jgi:hypothetical protein
MTKPMVDFNQIYIRWDLLSKLFYQDTEETWVTIYILLQFTINGYKTGLNPQWLIQYSKKLKAPCPENVELVYSAGNGNLNSL